MAFCRKFSVAPPLQNTLFVKFREPFRPTTGPLPAPTSNSSHPLLTNRRPDIMKPPLPLPLCDDILPVIVTVSLIVSGASIDCDIDMPDTSIDGIVRSLQQQQIEHNIHFTTTDTSLLYMLLTRIHHRTDWISPWHSHWPQCFPLDSYAVAVCVRPVREPIAHILRVFRWAFWCDAQFPSLPFLSPAHPANRKWLVYADLTALHRHVLYDWTAMQLSSYSWRQHVYPDDRYDLNFDKLYLFPLALPSHAMYK